MGLKFEIFFNFLIPPPHTPLQTVWIPELVADNRITGTRLAPVIRMDSLPNSFAEVVRSNGDLFEPLHQHVFHYRMRQEESAVEFCESILLRRAELNGLAEMGFDLAVCDMIDYCFVGIAYNVLSIRRYVFLSTGPTPESWEWTLGVPHPPSYVPALQDTMVRPAGTSFTDRLFNTYMVVGGWATLWRMRRRQQALFDKHIGRGLPTLEELASGRTWMVLHVGAMELEPASPITSRHRFIAG